MACSWNNYCPLSVNEENLQQLNCILFLVVKTKIWYIIRILKVFQGLLLPFLSGLSLVRPMKNFRRGMLKAI